MEESEFLFLLSSFYYQLSFEGVCQIKKKIILSISVFILLLVLVDAVRILFMDNIFLTVNFNTPKQLTLHEGEKNKTIVDENLIHEFYSNIRYKWVKRVSGDTSDNVWDNRIVVIDPKNSQTSFVVDNQGRIFFSKEKGEIRNKSPLHWIWWNFDNKSNNRTSIGFLAQPDSKLINIIKKMKANQQ